MIRPHRDGHRASLIVIADGLVACAALTVGCGGQNPKTTSIDSRVVDAGEVATTDATTDVTRPPSGDAERTDARDVDESVEEGEAAAEEGEAAPEEAAAEGGGEAGSPQACGLAACPDGAPCPDLTVDRTDLLASIVVSERTFQPTDCAIAEGCITTVGTRRLLRFDTGTVNSGTADLAIGDPTTNACFMFSQCHGHYHFRGVGVYTLYQADGTTVAAVGHKQGFCLEDVIPNPQLNPPPANPVTLYDCMSQGLHIGWEDIYPNDIDCQWIDITGVPPGPYILSVEINAGHYLPESNYENNEARVPVTID